MLYCTDSCEVFIKRPAILGLGSRARNLLSTTPLSRQVMQVASAELKFQRVGRRSRQAHTSKTAGATWKLATTAPWTLSETVAG